MMNGLLEGALQWSGRGLPVFPLKPRSKIPFTGSAGCKDATRNETAIRRWWSEKPSANIGVAIGDGFFVVDLDGRDAENWFLNACGPDETLEVQTARGRHVFFWAPCEIPNSAGLLAPKVDVRGHGGYVVAAPSAPSVHWRNAQFARRGTGTMTVNRSICGGRYSAPASFDALVSLTAWVIRFVCAGGADGGSRHVIDHDQIIVLAREAGC